jgi:hypothetical protein
MSEDILKEVQSHYQAWTNDNNIRLTRKYGWNDITDSYYGKLPDDWPFTSRTSDPRIRTALLEKNARLINGKLKGRLTPREGGDIVSAKIQNALLDYQWDAAQHGGSMHVKISISDMDTRLYQSKFALVPWKVEYDGEGEIKFEGNEFQPLDIRDCGMDFSATHIKNAKWFQYRTWEFIEDLEKQKGPDGKPIFKNLDFIKSDIQNKQKDSGQISSQRKDDYVSHVKQLKGLEDRVGTDVAFPVVEIVHELRDDRWIDFSPDHDEVIRDIKSPYALKKIHVVQLRYYPLQDDPLGESEVESVIPLWKAIQATLCGYMDEVILKMRPPLKILEGSVRLETIVYTPEAQWLMNRLDAVTEMQSSGQAIQYFQATYMALVSAFNTAMGMMSQGTSNLDATKADKTATEVRASMAQQNVRDQKNQADLSEFIKDIMMFWLANNKQFIFSDPTKTEYLIRIVGQENFAYFKQAGLDATDLSPEAAQTIADIEQQNPNTSQEEHDLMVQAGSLPRYPVVLNPEEKDPTKIQVKPKMKINNTGDIADVSMVPDDLDGNYDYIADVKSMAAGSEQELIQGRQNMLNTLITGPSAQNVIQLLAIEGFRPKVKEILSEGFEDLGMKDADRYFEKLPTTPTNGQNIAGQPPVNPFETGTPQMGSIQPPSPQPGLPGVPQTPPQPSFTQ